MQLLLITLFALTSLVSTTAASTIAIPLHISSNVRSQRESLRRCTSLQSDLSDASTSQETCELRQSTSVYKPSHTTPSEMAETGSRPPSKRLALHNSVRDLPDLHGTSDGSRIYTRLQTRLYPEMHFWIANHSTSPFEHFFSWTSVPVLVTTRYSARMWKLLAWGSMACDWWQLLNIIWVHIEL